MNQDFTSVGFLSSLQRESSDAWARLDHIYTPHIRNWIRRHGMRVNDADDIAQEVLLVVFRNLRNFQRGQVGSFRCWLRRITVNCLRDFRRKNWRYAVGQGVANMLQSLEDPNSRLSRQWDIDHDLHVLNYALTEVQEQFTHTTWLAFQRTAIEGQRAGEVAAELGITLNAVRIAKSRVSASVRKVVKGMLD